MGDLGWNDLIMELVDDTYVHERTVESMINSVDPNSNLYNYLQKLEKNSLCTITNEFNTSAYYQIDYSMA
jgi:hypothetical protein